MYRIAMEQLQKNLFEGNLETSNLILGKARPEDWEAMYRNVWSRPETARHMQWQVTTSPADAQARMTRTIAWQKNHDTYLVYEKSSGQAIGFAGVEEIAPHIYQDASIALGPEYVGKGYGKQILQLLLKYCTTLGGKEFYYSTRSTNQASRALARSCGLFYHHSEEKTDSRSGVPYKLEVYWKRLQPEPYTAAKTEFL